MKDILRYNQCPACLHTNIVFVLSCKDNTVSDEEFEIWECNNCTLRFTQDAPDEGEIGLYYQSANYVSHSDTKSGIINKLYHSVRNYTLKTKKQLLQEVTHKEVGNVLDVGAGTGAFAHTMQSAGWQVTGLEPDETARANAFKNYTLKLDTLDSLHTLPGQSYDAITLWHVLEHVHDLHGYLTRFEQLLKINGRLIIAVPNFTSFDASKYGKDWAAYDVPRHLYHFSPKSMEILLETKGLVVEQMKPMWFDSFYVSMLSEKYKNGTSNNLSAFYNGLVSNIKAFGNSKKCSSIIYIIKKETSDMDT